MINKTRIITTAELKRAILNMRKTDTKKLKRVSSLVGSSITKNEYEINKRKAARFLRSLSIY